MALFDVVYKGRVLVGEVMSVTLKDVAVKAGVSLSTVSRALNGQGRMAETTRSYIKNLANEMGYFPNYLAQILHEAQTKMIGVVITSVSDPFVAELVEGIEQFADSAGYTIFLGTSKFDPNKEKETILKFYQRRVDGIIVHKTHTSNFVDTHFESLDIPIVLINDEFDLSKYNNVTIDSKSEAKKAVDYLLSIGHERIAYVGSSIRFRSNWQRLQGYREAFLQRGMAVNEAHIFYLLPIMSDYETGRKALNYLLDTNVTAVFCYDDMIALGLMNACRERGIHIPDQLSVVGFDNIDQSSRFYPALTTIHQPKFELGKTAMQIIQNPPPQPVTEFLGCQLIVRESTKPLKLVP